MAITAAGSGTQTATLTTEHTLLDINTAGLYQLVVDTVNMIDGDILELRVSQIVLTGGTRRVDILGRFEGAQPTDELIKRSEPVGNELTDSGSVRFTLKQTVGSAGRAFPWKVLKYA